MIKTKEFSTPEYLAPTCKTINLSLEGIVCGSGDGNPNIGGGDVNDESDDWS